MAFVHLHVHSEYSLLDGACRIKEMAKYAKEQGQSALAITDHGVMYGVIDFYKACKAEGIRPIIGCEVYVAPRTRFDKVHKLDNSPYHLILLCENEAGYHNLIQLASAGFIDGFYHRPRVDEELLRAHSEGLIALSGCMVGQLPRLLRNGDLAGAVELAKRYADIFGKDHYYIEIQDHGIPEEKQVLPLLREVSRQTGIPMAATNDVHYLRQEDAHTQRVLMAIQTNQVVGQEGNLELSTEEFYLKSEEEMNALFADYPNAVENTAKIADRCRVEFAFGEMKLPKFTAPDGQDNESYLRALATAGMKRRYGTPDKEAEERLSYELSVITRMGYVDYYLIVHDIIDFARSAGIPVGPGRGSGAASIVAYAIGITDVDPMKYRLLFERFLNPERVSMPDFDIDFCYERRGEVIDYIIRRYGSDHVMQIVTFGTMAARQAVRDVGRALGMSYQEVDRIAKMIPRQLNATIDGALRERQDLRALYQTDTAVHTLIDTARRLEGMPRHASTHAAGVVITDREADRYVPLAKNDDAVVTQYPMTTLEELGLLKIDCLGLRNLTVIHDAEQIIRKTDPDFSVAKIPSDDAGVFRMMAQGDSDGVFQFESAGMKRVLQQLKPESLEDLIAVIALYRPGPMDSIPRYIENRHHPDRIRYLHPALKPILEVTYGCIVYQEQVMQICRALAGYSYGRADLVRRAMAKKKKTVMTEERTYFVHGKTNPDGTADCPGCVANGIPEDVANRIFDEMVSFASYAFNKAHAVCYATVAYQTAYLKRYAPAAYFAALLTSVRGSGKATEYIAAAAANGCPVLPPDINLSHDAFTVEGKGIRFGLGAVKNLGDGMIAAIMAEREKNGAFRDLNDFCERLYGKESNKRMMESLIRSGAMDCFPHNRREMLEAYPVIFERLAQRQKQNQEGQFNLFGNMEPSISTPIPTLSDFSEQEKMEMEQEMTGFFLSGHPLDRYEQVSRLAGVETVSALIDGAESGDPRFGDKTGHLLLGVLQEIKTTKTRSGDRMAFVKLEDRTGQMEALIFSALYQKEAHRLQKGSVIALRGTLSLKEEEQPVILAEEFLSPEALAARKTPAKLFLRVRGQDDPALPALMTALRRSPGKTRVILYFSNQKRYVSPPGIEGVTVTDPLLTVLSAQLGKDSIAVK